MAALSFESFISTRKQALTGSSGNTTKLDIVIGNESCDLDSAVSALSYAFLLQHQKNPDQQFIPVLNVPRRDYPLKTEVVFLFTKYGINQLDLIFLDDIEALRRNGRYNGVHLVDHNVTSTSLSDMEAHVKTIVDHHHHDCPINNKDFVKIEMVGSCTSLITNLFYERIRSVESDKLAQMLRATILTDTVCLRESAGKVKPLDIAMVERLEQEFAMSSTSREEVWREVMDAKSNITGFTTEQLLRKDSKTFTVSTSTISSTAYMSSVSLSVQGFLERDDIMRAISNLMLQNGARLLAILCNGGSDGVSSKHFILYTADNNLRSKLMHMVDCDPDLQFTDAPSISGYDELAVRKLKNVQISRKQVLPKLRSFLQTITMSEDLVTKFRSDSDLTFNLELSTPGTPVIIESPAPELYSSQENSGNHTPNPTFHVEAPPNSFKDATALDSVTSFLPSFNNSEMVKRIMIKKNRLADDAEEPCADGIENNSGNSSCPFTPANSFADRYAVEDLHLPSFNNREMLHRMLQKKLLIGSSGDISPAEDSSAQQIFTPHNSECEGELDSTLQFDQSDLENRLNKFEASELYESGRREVEDTAHAVVDSVMEQAMHKVNEDTTLGKP
ncbi:exopolyphosphatase PRUNE1-like isoform X2 [Watersipora subatra]|uniref:exopolyphosphatase PRUNE1-like isoform X2 n=1 Tax=Watersipora subatra TaxID=2589382 RepID=UPI00355BB52F